MRVANSLKIIGVFAAFVLASCAFIVLDGRVTVPEPVVDLDGKQSLRKGNFYDIAPSANKPGALSGETGVLPVFQKPAEMRLLALFQAYHTGLASAVVHVQGMGAYRYRTGDEVQPGVTLGAILPDRVLLRTAGGVEALHLQAMRRLSDENMEEPPEKTEGPVVAGEDEEQIDSEAMKFLTRLDLYPINETAPEGYLVGNGFPPEATEQTGIKPGDIIVSVNGYPVGEASSDYLVWLSFRSTHKAAVLVRNEERDFFIYYPDDIVQSGSAAQ